MTESVTKKELISLEKKLENAIASRTDLENDLMSQSSVFVGFINKLSLACKGMDLELDNRLANFRQSHKKSQSFAVLSEQIDVILGLLKHQASKNEKNVSFMHNKLTTLGKTLQKSNNIPPQTRRDLREFISSLDEHKETVVQYVPAFDTLLTLYQETLIAKQVDNSTTNADDKNAKVISTNSSESEKNNSLERLKENILLAITTINLSERNQKTLLEVKRKMSESMSHDAILKSLIHIFSIIASDLQDERNSAKYFLASLNKTLSHVQKAVASTISSTNSIKQQNVTLNSRIQEQLSAMSKDIEKAKTLETVKLDINDKLTTIVDVLNDKQKFEDSADKLIQGKLADMTKKVKQLEDESQSYKKRLEEQIIKSKQDGLTKLNNRGAFDEFYTNSIEQFKEQVFPLSIVVIDLDDFKRINDTYGHTAGDKTLKVIANTIMKKTDKKAFVARFGGEEFVIVFPHLDKISLINELNLLRKNIALLPFTFKNNKVSMTTSIGCTHVKATDNIRTSFERADNALYQAKEQGKNRVIYVD